MSKRKGKGTIDPSAPVRDNKGRFVGSSKQRPLELTPSPIIVNSGNEGTQESDERDWSSDLTSLTSSEDEEVHSRQDRQRDRGPQGSQSVQVVMYTESIGSSSMDTGPSPKRQKTVSMSSMSTAKETIPLLTTLRWVHDTMKTSLNEAHSKSAQEFTNCCNWWYRVILWKKKEFTKTDKDQFCQSAFGTLAVQLQYNENGATTGNEPIGVKVHRQWTKYGKQIHHKLRRNFEALLLMFLESPDMKGLVDVWFGVVRESSPRAISLETPCLSAIDIRDRFLKSQMQLVSDVWYPIIDVAPLNFLVDNGMWGGRFLDATCVTLAWMFTHFIRVDKAEEKTKFEVGKCPIPADLITASIYKGDGATAIPQDWFELNKPNEWKSRKAVGGPYGKLKFVKLNYEVAIDVLDEAIDREIADPESGVTLPRASEAMKELFNYEKIEEQTDYVMAILRARIAAARNLEALSRKTAEELESKCDNTIKTLMEYKINSNRPGQDIQRRMQTERFIHEAKAMFIDAQNREQSQAGGFTLGQNFTSTEVLGGFACWLGLLKKEGYFISLCSKYDAGLFTGLPGTGMMMGGNTGYSGQVWSGMVGGYPQGHGWGSQQVIPVQHHMVSCSLKDY